MAIRDITDADSGDFVHSGLSVTLNKHGKEAGVSKGDLVEFDAKVTLYEGKTVITAARGFRRLTNY
jgi:hypothetical protein